MRDKISMGMSDSINNLSKEKLSLVLGYLMVLDIIVKLAALGQLHDHEDVVGRI